MSTMRAPRWASASICVAGLAVVARQQRMA